MGQRLREGDTWLVVSILGASQECADGQPLLSGQCVGDSGGCRSVVVSVRIEEKIQRYHQYGG